ncbi:Hemin transport protein HmuS [Thioalkalivibrio nitratireducens DSM 14787]|uniref:Hemin transport protein HmuS n=2 Tax=Thioalkalivibrio nitratireducens TaxID=186931 RepID=L0DVB4_THIND|nr:Hemin transport protein HmuS [Thioalkalivibrio nitratireducens DSM 14787]
MLRMESQGRRLHQAWHQLRQGNPRLRARDGARQLGVSEGELVASGCGTTAVRLQPRWQPLLHALGRVGPVMALTRNEHAVHERHGRYRNIRLFGNMGLVLDDNVDLRLFLAHWHHAFAVTEATVDGHRKSLQIFDSDGTAVHKVYLTAQSDEAAYRNVVEEFRSPVQTPLLAVVPRPVAPTTRPEEAIDVAGLRRHWDALQDTHDFHDLLQQFGVTRIQAMRLAGEERAREVAPDALRQVFESARDAALPIMVFVGSPGVVQIHTGTVSRLHEVGEWYNVLDPTFNLHVREPAIASAWMVKKPTVDGPVHSLELYAQDGQLILQVFGARKPGKPEDLVWRSLIRCLQPFRERT